MATKAAKVPKKRKSTINIWKSKRDKKFYFHMASSNGKVVLPAGQGYSRRVDLVKTLNAVIAIFREGRVVIFDETK